MGYAAKIIADSVNLYSSRLTTFEVTYPRSIHAEMCRHRNQSRNSASSRAIPINRMIANATDDTFLPIYYGKNQAGMSAAEELDADTIARVQEKIIDMADTVADFVRDLANLGLHKQTANRYLEPFIYHTEIISATSWSNFFALRISDGAQPEIRKIAEMMKALLEDSTPYYVPREAWHLPFINADEFDELGVENAKKVSVARCARVSYNRHNDVKDLQVDLDLFDRLTSSGHWSCTEHIATPAAGRHGNFNGWKQLRQTFPHEDDFGRVLGNA